MEESARTGLTDTPAFVHQDMKVTIANGTSMIVTTFHAEMANKKKFYKNIIVYFCLIVLFL